MTPDTPSSQTETAPAQQTPPQTQSVPRRIPLFRQRRYWLGQVRPAFWTVASVMSLVVNVILIVILIIIGRELFTLRAIVGDQLIGGLHQNFVLMDQARIQTNVVVNATIPVQFTLPVSFDLPVQTNTDVVLTEDTTINNATVNLRTGGLLLESSQTDIVLPKGTRLPVALDIQVPVNTNVPVDTTVPVQLNVPVDIPLNQTELHQPFVGLQNVVSPYKSIFDRLPRSWKELWCARDAAGNCQ